MRPHGRFAHCSCKNAVRQPPVLASCIEVYYFTIVNIHLIVSIFKYTIFAAPLSYTARLCTFRIHDIRFYTLSISHVLFTTHLDCHSSRYYTPRLPTFRLRTFGHPYLRCYTLLFLYKAIVHNAFTTHLDSTHLFSAQLVCARKLGRYNSHKYLTRVR